MLSITAIFLYLLLSCGRQNSPARSASEISADILSYFQYEPDGENGFISPMRAYLKEPNAVDFSSPKVMAVKGFIDKKKATVVLLVYWVGMSEDATLEVFGDTGKFLKLEPFDVDKSLDNEVHIAKYLGSAYYEFSEKQYAELKQMKWIKLCVGRAKSASAYMFHLSEDTKGNILGINDKNRRSQ